MPPASRSKRTKDRRLPKRQVACQRAHQSATKALRISVDSRCGAINVVVVTRMRIRAAAASHAALQARFGERALARYVETSRLMNSCTQSGRPFLELFRFLFDDVEHPANLAAFADGLFGGPAKDDPGDFVGCIVD